MLSALKAQEQHKRRMLSEARIPFAKPTAGGKVFSKPNIRAAASRAGVTDRRAVSALIDVLTLHPHAVLNSAFWKQVGAGAASFFLHGTFDPNYSVPEVGGAMSHRASSLERIGGQIGTGAYKAGRALQKAEKWFNTSDPDARRFYSRDSAFNPTRSGAIDACIKRRVGIANGPDAYIGYDMGTREYEQCVNNPQAQDEVNIRRNAKHYKHLPGVLRELGVDPDRYMKMKRHEFTRKRGKSAKKRFKHLRNK